MNDGRMMLGKSWMNTLTDSMDDVWTMLEQCYNDAGQILKEYTYGLYEWCLNNATTILGKSWMNRLTDSMEWCYEPYLNDARMIHCIYPHYKLFWIKI